ncbi:MAG: hypothetical protein U0V56_06920 [Actinomycetota bacterium]
MVRILVGTREGLRSFDERGNEGPVQLEGRSIGAVVRDDTELWASSMGPRSGTPPTVGGGTSRRWTVSSPPASR